MKLVKGDRLMEVYYWEEEGDQDVTGKLAGAIVELGPREFVLIPEGFDDVMKEAILTEVWPKR